MKHVPNRHVVTPRVLVFPARTDADGVRRALFLEGGPTKWFAGRLNGLGGSVERGEDVTEAARRELTEECGLAPLSISMTQVVHVDADPCVILFVFRAELPPGEVRASPEGRLVWLTQAQVVDPATPLLPDVLDFLGGGRFRTTAVRHVP